MHKKVKKDIHEVNGPFIKVEEARKKLEALGRKLTAAEIITFKEYRFLEVVRRSCQLQDSYKAKCQPPTGLPASNKVITFILAILETGGEPSILEDSHRAAKLGALFGAMRICPACTPVAPDTHDRHLQGRQNSVQSARVDL